MSGWRWEDQYRRMCRYRDKIDRSHHDESRTEYEDELWSFFQHAWHLKDWLKNDPNASATESRVEDLANGSNELRIAADLCNRTKHYTLTRKPREDADFGGVKLEVRIKENLRTGESTSEESWDWSVELGNGTSRWARQLAHDIVDEWDRIIQELGLTLP